MAKFNFIHTALAFFALATPSILGHAAESDDAISYSAGFTAVASSGRTSPYMIGSWNEGRTTMKNSAALDASIHRHLNRDGRWGWGFGAEIMAGYHHGVDFAHFDASSLTWGSKKWTPAAAQVINLYGEARYRSLYAMAGMKTHQSKIVASYLSSGDLILSNNARPIPGLTIGFVDFQDIPFINGWVQIDGRIMYGKMFDNGFREAQFNHMNGMLARDLYYTYKYCYFRTKPSMPLYFTFGMQTAGMFGGQTQVYRYGAQIVDVQRGFQVKDIFKMFFPTPGNGNSFYEGNSLGTWSLRADYRLCSGNNIAVYWEKLFEDGSGIGCRNGMDALYGIDLSLKTVPWLNHIVVEYLDFSNQSGPMHWAPADSPGTTITTEATGGDNYYNNDSFGPYTNYGLSIGSPMVMSTIYNADGYPEFIYNRMRGLHLGVSGDLCPTVSYKLMFSRQKGYGMGRTPLPLQKTDTSVMAAVDWRADCLYRGLSVSAKVAFDHGSLRGNNVGAELSIRYTGAFNH